MTVYRGKVVSFASGAWTASIRLDGSAAQTIENVPVSSDIAETDMDIGAKVLVDTGDHNHPADLVVFAAWPGPPAPLQPPTGGIIAWPTATAPTGWLLADGSAVSRTTYAALFALIASVYGAGDGSTTFNVPNLKGRVPVGFDSGQTEFDALGETGGSKTHTLITAEIPAHLHVQDTHNHTQNPHTHLQNQHLHAVTDPTHFHSVAEGQTDGDGTLFDKSNAADGTPAVVTDAAATGISIQNTTPTNQDTTPTNVTTVAVNKNTGGGGAHQNLPPYIALNYIIKT